MDEATAVLLAAKRVRLLISLDMSSHMKREVCESCSKQIYIGQRIAICKQCDIIVHKKCALKNNNLSFMMFRENLYCNTAQKCTKWALCQNVREQSNSFTRVFIWVHKNTKKKSTTKLVGERPFLTTPISKNSEIGQKIITLLLIVTQSPYKY